MSEQFVRERHNFRLAFANSGLNDVVIPLTDLQNNITIDNAIHIAISELIYLGVARKVFLSQDRGILLRTIRGLELGYEASSIEYLESIRQHLVACLAT